MNATATLPRASPTRSLGKWAWRLALFLIAVAAALATFFAGMHIHQVRVFPYQLLATAHKTLIVNAVNAGLWDAGGPDFRAAQCASSDSQPAKADTQVGRLSKDLGLRHLLCPAREDAAAARVEFVAGGGLTDPIIVKGEFGTFLDHCPGPAGCLAVEYARSGAITRVWPFRPEKIAQANIVSESDYPYELPVGWSMARNVSSYNVSLFPGGDLLVVFYCAHSHPAACGVARISPGDGEPRWYRKDYSHHWPHVVDEDMALVPGRRRGGEAIFPLGPQRRKIHLELKCADRDQVNVINGSGDLLEEIPLFEVVAASRYAGILVGATKCKSSSQLLPNRPFPLHLNFVHMLGEDAGGAAGIAPGDLVVSLRNLSAFGVLDKDDRRLKRLVRGSFHWQHGVRHLEKARFMMFDNLGTDGTLGPSRLLMVDLATGAETTLFPNDATPAHLRDWFAEGRGQFDVSSDRSRVLLVDPEGARAFEIRLADGLVLNVFRQLHDLEVSPGFPERLTGSAWLFEFHGIHYANRWEKRR